MSETNQNPEIDHPPFQLRGWAMCKQLAALGDIADLIDAAHGTNPSAPCPALEDEDVRDALFERLHGALFDGLKVLSWLKAADHEGRFSDPESYVWHRAHARAVIEGGSPALRKILDDYGIEQSARPQNLQRS